MFTVSITYKTFDMPRGLNENSSFDTTAFLITTLLMGPIFKTFNTGDVTYNDINYNINKGKLIFVSFTLCYK